MEEKQVIAQWVEEIDPHLSEQEKKQAVENVSNLIDWMALVNGGVLTDSDFHPNVKM